MSYIEQLRNRFNTYYDSNPTNNDELQNIEKKLSIKLPVDFKEISKFYSGGFLGGISHNEIAVTGHGTTIVDKTIRLQNSIGLAHYFVVLAEPPESLIVMDTSRKPGIIWCDAVEANNLNSGIFINQPDTWDDYSDFFSYLLDEEEDE